MVVGSSQWTTCKYERDSNDVPVHNNGVAETTHGQELERKQTVERNNGRLIAAEVH